MSYQQLDDILPIVLDATKKGHLKWVAQAGGNNRDFIVSIGAHRLEVELDLELEGRPVKVYLWNSNSNILDSTRVSNREDNYSVMLDFFETVQRSAANVPSILSEIVSTLQSLD